MMIRSMRLPWAIGVLLVLIAVPSLRAGELTDQVKQTTDKILAIVQDPALKDPNHAAERRTRIRKVVDERFDWDAMARSAMGTHWRTLTDAQKKEFVGVFSRLVEQTYMARVENYSGEKIVYKAEKAVGKYGAVNVGIITLAGTEIPVSYRLVQEDKKWMAYDVTIEGVSLVNNYRSQIGSILDKSSFEDLLKKIRATLEKGEAAGADPNAPLKSGESPRPSPP
jgi:phospholipid transport system substrate-binding protein